MPALSVEAPEPSFVDAIAPIKEPVSQVLREETSPTIPPLPGVLALPAERLEVVVAEREPPGLPPLPEEPVTAAPPVTEAPPGVPLPPPQKETTPPVITILPAAPKASALASAPVLPALPSSPERPALGELIAEQKPASPAPVAEIPAHAAPQEPPVVTVILPIEPPADLPLAADDAGGGAEGASVAVTPQPGVPIGAVAADENLQESPAAVHRPPAVPVDSSEDVIALLGDDSVASIVAQPELPEELRPSGIPILRPGRLPKKASVEEDERLLADMPLPLQKSTPPRLPSLLPEPEQDLGIVYVFPFVTVMVPEEVDDRLFDQFIDTLNDQGASLNLQFVILKEGLQRVDPAWLAVRKYVTGEIYAYVEDSGCCSTDLRTKARVTYRRPRQAEPAFNFEYTTKRFFDHDHSTLVKERVALADNLARILADKLLESMKN